MIHFVTTRDHGYTFRHLVPRLGADVARRWTYEKLFHRRALPGGTWVFCDQERLSPHELALAARIAHHLRAGGARVLNDPARVVGRGELLRRLKAAEINRFSAWRADADPRPDTFPVFIRNEYDHRVGTPRLLASQAELDAELLRLRAQGYPLAGKLVIEYAGEEVAPGLWQRLQTYCVGGVIIAHTCAVDFKWVVKDLKDHARLEAHPHFDRILADEQAFIYGNLHAEALRRAFAVAEIDYGRADFALVGGHPQIYEINTNPTHADHAKLFRQIHPRRREVQRLSEDTVHAALRALDSAGAGPIAIEDEMLPRASRSRRAWWQRLLRHPAPAPRLPRP